MLLKNDLITVASLNVGQRRIIGQWAGKPVESAIARESVGFQRLALNHDGLEGDEQVDRSVHGGSQKAVYVYPYEHYAAWERELGQSLEPGAFGENVTVLGALEADVRVGHIFLWGNAAVRVVKYRQPCIKLNLHRDTPDMIQRMRANGRCGWYLEVLVPGHVSMTAPMMLMGGLDEGQPSIAELFRQKFPNS